MRAALKSIILLSLFSSFTSFAATPSMNQDHFCNDRKDPTFVKELTRDSSNLMGFRNFGGIGGAGVCWWHSRFQRNALYLTIFQPDAVKPTEEEARIIIKKIRKGKEIVQVPGYNNLQEFSTDFLILLQSELESWQLSDGAKFAWIRGLKGNSVVTPEKMQMMMDELYQEVETQGNIAYQKLQIKGITAHAWLVVSMTKEENGYLLEVIDSNYPRMTMFYQYEVGDTHLVHEYYGVFTPYLEETKEMAKISMIIKESCNPQMLSKR
ncbi:MAG: hypothetical protein NDI69_05935 [Bacteriovoracaceae bacterium]|nr:hypothetical protein [Bacteriovoracaceae bacterium]